MGVNTQTPPYQPTPDLKIYKNVASHNGFTSAAADLPIPPTAANSTGPFLDVVETNGWRGYFDNSNDTISTTSNSIIIDRAGSSLGNKVALIPVPPLRQFSQSQYQSATFDNGLWHYSHDNENPSSSSGTIDLPPGPGNPIGEFDGPFITFVIKTAGVVSQKFIVFRSGDSLTDPADKIMIGVGSQGTPISYTTIATNHPEAYSVDFGFSDGQFQILGQAVNAFDEPASLVIFLEHNRRGGMGTDEFVFSDYVVTRPPPNMTPETEVVELTSCRSEATVDSDLTGGTFTIAAGNGDDVTLFRSQNLRIHTGDYALSLETTGDVPKIQYVNRFGEVIEINNDQVTDYITDLKGFYFPTAIDLGGLLGTDNFGAWDRNNEGGFLRFTSAPGKSGTITNAKLENVKNYVIYRRYENYSAPNIESFHADEDYDWIFMTGVAFSLPPVEDGFNAGQVIAPFTNQWLFEDAATGVLSGTPNQIERGVVYGCRYKVVSRLQYDALKAISANAFPTLVADPAKPAADGSVGNLLPNYTGGESSFTAALHSGSLPPGFVIESATGRIYHPGNGIADNGNAVTEAAFAISTPNGTFISPTYKINQGASPLPFVEYPNYTNDPSGFRDGQIYWDTKFPAGSILPRETFNTFGQPATFEISSGSLPAGLTLDFSTGEVSGTFGANQQNETGRMDVLITNYQNASQNASFIFNWKVVAN